MDSKRIAVFWLMLSYGIMGPGIPVTAQDADFIPVFNPRLTASRTTRDIKIDGRVNDSEWLGAAGADTFAERYPGDKTRPPVVTEALITYDEERLYVAFICHDDPSTIRASFCERDKIFNDDNIKLCIDTYGDAAWAYIFYVNAYGIQADAIWSSSGGEEIGYDLIWESAGIVTDSGYQVEMAIPFTSLRFPNRDDQVWRVDFWRNHPRETEAEYSWAAYDRDENCWPCQWGTVSGISGVAPGRGIEIAPSVIGQQSGGLHGNGLTESPYSFVNHDPDGELSVWGKYAVSSNTTMEATLNPDFSQIEADAGQIDVNTTYALFYPEQRPFFQEGKDLFTAAIPTIYSRSINDPIFALKAIHRSGGMSLGYLLARDENSPIIIGSEERSDILLAGRSTSNLARLRYSIGEGSEMGAIITDQRFDNGGSGSSVTHDALFRLAPSVRLRYHVTVSRVSENDDPALSEQMAYPDSTIGHTYTRAFDGESFWGHFGYGYLGWWTGTWNASLAYTESSPTYRQHNGFIRQTDYRSVRNVTGYFFRIPDGLFETINPHIRLEAEWNFDGKPHYRTVEANLWTRLRASQAGFYTQYVRSARNFGGRRFDPVWYVYQDAQIQIGDPVEAGGLIRYGRQIAWRYVTMGKVLDVSLWSSIKPHARVLVQQWLDYARATQFDSGEELYEGYIYRTRLNYQVSRPLAVRLVVEYDDFSELWRVDPLLTYRLNPFSVFYAGMTSNYRNLGREEASGDISYSNRLVSRQFFVKLQYLFQL